MRQQMRWLLPLLVALALLAPAASPRAGGGDTYSGGSDSGGGSSDYSSSFEYSDSSSGGGGGSDGGALAMLATGLFLFLALVAQDLNERSARKRAMASGKMQPAARPYMLKLLNTHVGNFSRVMFDAFVRLVYTRYHESQGGFGSARNALAVAPYLSPALRATFKAAGDESGWIVVGAQRITRVVEAHGKLAVSVHIKANLRLKTGDKFKRQLLSEELRFERPVGVASREPEKVYSLGCPACGASQELTLRGTCASCGTAIGGGELDWQLTQIKTLARTDVGEGVISQAAEVGTDLPTVVHPLMRSRWRALTVRDPQLTKELLLARFKMIFVAIQKGWTMQDASLIRPHELDTLYDMHVYWLARFKEERIRNVLENLKVKRIELAKIDHDAWYDAVTVRIRAEVDDFYVDAEGNPLAGEAGREFTEYWTFIRRSGREHGVPRAKPECPSCGAALDKVNQAGICEYCGNKVVTGDFDWVLATIEQDEEYRG